METKELYTEDSYLKECSSEVVLMQDQFITFNKTIFYPGGGGQPCDIGVIKQGDEIYRVLNVNKVEGKIIHELDRPLHDISQPVVMQIDWDWRFKNMQYHTLLHVISGYMYQHYNGLATSSQIEMDYARLELSFSPDIIEEIPFDRLEESIKKILSDSHEVIIRTISRVAAEQKEGAIKTVINLLPASLNEIRVVQIKDIDEQACGGTHVNNTTEINDFSIVKIQNKGQTKKRIRIQLTS
ncbi:alanyl-tRNA editing protein [Paenibacillus amylolyticus]|uniref:Threonyl/alanyl tRNA synthetase, SAD n=1 Tax=Paenibacillus amylolyticus TaxID=1451 RepID=A0A100VNJ8_PAEAM|nr:alanyl-tRNA editing protein [Paenibacillus amylolyticus]GAS83153.1 threonyl/alanyl tRNA synthetase, SAD [Paenibacillus amylolyticus]